MKPVSFFQRRRDAGFAPRRAAVSLTELLVVLSILAALLSLLLPAVQAARESSRRSNCQSNLKQISLALLGHHEARQSFPFGGWGHEWIGVPGRGSGKEQPGGWIYSILPYMEETELHDLGQNADGAEADTLYARRLMTILPMFTCPTRRVASNWPVVPAYMKSPRPHGKVSRVSRSDYAINGGASRAASWPGPATLLEGDDPRYWKNIGSAYGFSGISHLHVSVSLAAVEDGTSNTYLLGEKSLDPAHYEDGLSQGDNESMFSGYCTDLHRFSGTLDWPNPFVPPIIDGNEKIDPRGFLRFGSAHYRSFLMAFCDGSVRLIDYEIDPEVHLRCGHRKDNGRPLSALK